jgi:RimJ/RimL family protein N-acetyltransferase
MAQPAPRCDAGVVNREDANPGCRSGLVSTWRVRAGDREAVREVFDGLSEESRRLRFHGPKPRLADAEVDMLADVGCCGREAVGALDLRTGEVVGIARFVQDAEDPSTAEVAFAVVDSCQGNGVASRLLRELTSLAKRDGVERFVAHVAAGNDAALTLLRRVGRVASASFADGAHELVVEL